MKSRLKNLFRMLIGRKEKKPSKSPKSPEYPEFDEAEKQFREARVHLRRASRSLRSPPRKAIHQDIGKFMRGSKHQHRYYRRSVRAKINPEEEHA